ncbi:MAG: hypothetical protein ACLPVY_27580 [Acidimicrobiia bacterium]
MPKTHPSCARRFRSTLPVQVVDAAEELSSAWRHDHLSAPDDLRSPAAELTPEDEQLGVVCDAAVPVEAVSRAQV